MWRSGLALRPYFHDVRMVVHNKAMFPDLQGFNIVDREALSFVHFPIRDCGITDDERVLELSRTLVKAISEGEIIYLHCWGGHGRTGTLVCIMLHLMYSVSISRPPLSPLLPSPLLLPRALHILPLPISLSLLATQLILLLTQLDSVEAMTRCQMVHDLRKCPVVVGSPQTQTQRDQVTRVIRRLMTNTSFHRRTLSDIFSHAGAARLSVLMDEESQRSPRSDAASACAPYCTGRDRDMDCRLASDGANSTGGEDDDDEDDDDDEEEGVIAMGLDCLDNDNDLNFVDVSEVADHQAAYYPHCFPAMSSTHLTRDNVDSYIDSDASVSGRNAQRNAAAAMVVACQLHCRPPPPTHAADITSPAFADHHRRQNFQNLLEASDQCGVGMRDCLPHSLGSTGSSASHDEQGQGQGQPMAVTWPVEENRQLDALMEQREQDAYQQQQQQHIACVSSSAGHEEQGQGQHRSGSNGSSNCNGSSSNHSRNLAYIGNGSASSESGSDKSSLGPTSSAADCCYYGSAVAVATLDSREMCVEGEGTSFQATDTVELSTPSEHTSRHTPAPVPVPMPPPGSCRPSTTPCSSSSSGNGSGASPGVLAGLRNFRLQWGGSAGTVYSTTHSATGAGAGQPLVAQSDNKDSSASTPAPSSMAAGAAVTETDFSGVLPNSNHSD